MIYKIAVAIPTSKRPELLALCLEKISATKELPDLDIRIFLDHSFPARLDDVEWVRDEYCPQATIHHANNHVLLPSGVWNILNSLKESWETKTDFLCLIEEDVLVTPNFFEKHLEMQESDDYFVTCGRKLPNKDKFYYSNPGTCYRREKFGLVIPHINERYFANLSGYLEEHFPNMDDAGVLDDGIIRRVMQSVNGRALCAVPPIAFHAGFHYFNRFSEYKTSGTIQQRIEQARNILRSVSPEGRYTRDFEPFR